MSADIMDNDLRRYKAYASGIKRTLLIAGLWPDRGSPAVYRLHTILYSISCVLASSGMMCFVFNHITNLALVTKGFGLAISYYATILKLIVFTIYRQHLVEVHELLETGFRKDLENPKLRPVLLSPLEYFHRPTLWLSVSTWMLVSIYNLTPLISLIMQRIHGVEPLKYHTPLPIKYPWSYEKNVVLYIIQYVAETFTSFAIGAVTVGTDALFGFYVFQMTSQLRTMSYKMANLSAIDDYHSVIKECVTRRQMLVRCRDKLQILYGPIVLWMLTTSAMTICANIFQASQISIEKGILVMVYIIMKLIQTLLYGWYGLFLTTESEAFRESIYCSGWSDSGDKSFLSNILIMLMYKPLVLKACHFSVISLDMFMAIMNTALSYFFLLQTLDGK